MDKPIKSRHGLTRCTVCRAHIHADERPSGTDCPFCGANLHRSRGRISLPTGRGGLLAASLFAFAAAGCSGGDASDDSTSVEPGDDNSGDDNSGNDNTGLDDQYADDPPDDNAAVAEYGVPPDRYEGESEEPPPEPVYGVPPE